MRNGYCSVVISDQYGEQIISPAMIIKDKFNRRRNHLGGRSSPTNVNNNI